MCGSKLCEFIKFTILTFLELFHVVLEIHQTQEKGGKEMEMKDEKFTVFKKRPHLSGNGKVHCIIVVCLSWPDTQGASLLPTLWICSPQFHVFPPIYPGQPQPAVSPWAAQSLVLRTCLKLGNATDSNLWTIRRWSGLGSAAVGGHFPGGSLSKFDNQTPDTLYNLHLTIFWLYK